jgi:GST-like protein
MIDLYFWTTPNGYKPLLLLEEAGLAYRLIPVNIHRGEQFDDAFSRVSPNQRIPAIVDNEPLSGPWAAYQVGETQPISIFESGAILLYLAEKTGRFYPADNTGRAEVLQWLFWQMGGLGPMLGQNYHFARSPNEKIPYAIDRYVNETKRLFTVLNEHLKDREYIAGEYSIADMACYPWIIEYPHLSVDIDCYPHVKAWEELIKSRPATQRAYATGSAIHVDERAALNESNTDVIITPFRQKHPSTRVKQIAAVV